MEGHAIVCFNEPGRAQLVVAPFASGALASEFALSTVNRAYAGFTVVPVMTAEEYVKPAVPA